MKARTFFVLVIIGQASVAFAQKDALVDSINQRSDASWEMARKIWEWAEPGYQERKSSALLADTLEKAGFTVERGVAKIPTAFTATYGQGKPVIAILGEYDALPELGQATVPYRERVSGNGYGHGCGHHLFGVASASASIAIKEQIEKGNIKGTVRFYGCPAEEGGSGKIFMVLAGLFQDVDACLHWHPGNSNGAGDSSCLSRMAVKFRFHGKAAHAAGAPEKGRSALDAVQLTCHAAELMREHCPDLTRIHHVITHGGGGAPNVVPEFAEVYFYIRHPKSDVVAKLYPRLVKCAQGGALATETKLEIKYEGGMLELLPNDTLAQVTKANLTKLNDIAYDAEEEKSPCAFRNRSKRSRRSTASRRSSRSAARSARARPTWATSPGWCRPPASRRPASSPAPPATPGKTSPPAVRASAAKACNWPPRRWLTSTWDIFQDPKIIAAAKDEQKRKLDGRAYRSLMEKDQQPPLDYRDPPKR